jgi:peptidoglycan/LPS O-acetylase OafA/YrhL
MNQKPTTSRTGERLYSLQILRGLAAVAILMFHVERYTKIVGGINDSIFNHVPLIFGQGAFWFFEISGFIMAYLIDRNLNKDFLLQRAMRIYPPYFLAVVTSVFLFVMFLGSYAIPRRDLFQALTLLPSGQITYVLGVEWSLTYEIFFYVVCSVLVIGRLRKYHLHFLVAWFFIILAVQFQQANVLLELHQIPFSQYNYYFIMGGFVYYFNRHKRIADKFASLTILGMSVILYTLLLYFRTYLFISPSLLLSVAFAGLLYAILQFEIPSTNPLVKLGDYSYGIYLVHVPIVTIILKSWLHFVGRIDTYAGSVAFGAALLFGWYFGKLEVALHRRIKTWHGLRYAL